MSRRMRLAGHVIRMGREEVYRSYCGENEGKDTVWKTGVEERIILKWIFRK
jgi:hypothetical protein